MQDFLVSLAPIYELIHTIRRITQGTWSDTTQTFNNTSAQYDHSKAGMSDPAYSIQLPCCRVQSLDQA